MRKLRGVAVGAGYFSQFHFDAWLRMQDVELTAVCDVEPSVASQASKTYGIPNPYSNFEEMLEKEQPDFVDIITRPESHLGLVTAAVDRGIPVICQKALAPSFEEAKKIVEVAKTGRVPLMVHENFRFQPWYREIRHQIDAGVIGDRLHRIFFQCRTGDGWQEDAYLARQPYFREMPRLLIFETGVHFIDSFRFLAGEIESVYCSLSKLNTEIAGEDAAIMMFEFQEGGTGIWDGNRYNEPTSSDARFTFGEALIEGDAGSLRLDGTGRLTLQRLGQIPHAIEYECPRRGFAGDCVFATQRHFIDQLRGSRNFETSGEEYLKTLAIVEAAYKSASSNRQVRTVEEGS